MKIYVWMRYHPFPFHSAGLKGEERMRHNEVNDRNEIDQQQKKEGRKKQKGSPHEPDNEWR